MQIVGESEGEWEGDRFEELGVDTRIILKQFFK
jgi:hypothetical protein